tara:strand:- start:1621 stop:2235 length:615 start_codon:yes stop_codon:yes gene_type:complete
MNFQQQKERQDMILEPLQVMIQLSLVSFCPVGTKVSISNNILHIQKPTISQGVVRWWYGDNKDDLYYLFHAIRRYYLWYKSDSNPIYGYILKNAIKGIDCLINTYKNTKLTTITTTLQMYKNILDLENEELFKTEDAAVNLDSVFQNITNIYEQKILAVVYNIIKIMETEEDDQNIDYYFDAIHNFLSPTNLKIQQWIRDKLTC